MFLNYSEYENISEGIKYHIRNNLSISESIYRIGSDSYCEMVNELRRLWKLGKIELSENDQFIVENLKTGTKAVYQGKDVVLDTPEKTPSGDNKQFQVYRDSGKKDDDGNIIAKIIKWGDPNLSVKNCDEEASKSFRARHKCSEKTDKDTPGWWACSVHRFWKQLGLECSDPW